MEVEKIFVGSLENHISDAIEILATKLCRDFGMASDRHYKEIATMISTYGCKNVIEALSKACAIKELLGWEKLSYSLFNAVLIGEIQRDSESKDNE